MKELNYIDLFAGAGGLSEGFIRAGFKPIAHVEMNKEACDTIKTRAAYAFVNRFQVVNGKGVSHTVVAHIAMDGHYYIHPDKKQNRSISVREAARIQSFPDDYFFEGSRTAAFKQIGNAVSFSNAA